MSKPNNGQKTFLKSQSALRRITRLMNQLENGVPSAEIKVVEEPLPNSFEAGKHLVKPKSQPQPQPQQQPKPPPQTTLTAVIFTPMQGGLGVLVSRDHLSCIFPRHSVDVKVAKNREVAARQLCLHTEQTIGITIAEMLFITHYTRSGRVKEVNEYSFLGTADLRTQGLPRKYPVEGQREREAVVIDVREAVNQLTPKYLSVFKLALGSMGTHQPRFAPAMSIVQRLVQNRLNTIKQKGAKA